MSDTVITSQPAQPEQAVSVQQDYWGTDEKGRFVFPDGVTYIEFQIMNEGAKSRFQKMTSQNMTVTRTGDATVKIDPAKERHELIIASCTGWNLVKEGTPILFSRQMLEKWLDVAPPKLVEDLEFKIRTANPWLQQDMTVEEIDKELDRLNELRAAAKERESGEDASANR